MAFRPLPGCDSFAGMFEDRRPKLFHETPAAERRQPVLELGQVVATPGAVTALAEAGLTGERFLFRHSCGDWGDVDEHDRAANDLALEEGTRVLSTYQLPTQVKLWIITEWDRSVTTLLLPEEY